MFGKNDPANVTDCIPPLTSNVSNAPRPISFTVDGILTLVSEVSLNALSSIVVRFSGKVISVSLLQPLNASSQILTQFSGIVTDFILVSPSNTAGPIVFTISGITTSLLWPLYATRIPSPRTKKLLPSSIERQLLINAVLSNAPSSIVLTVDGTFTFDKLLQP